MTKLAESLALLIADMAEGQRESLTVGALRDTLLPKLISSTLRIGVRNRFLKGRDI